MGSLCGRLFIFNCSKSRTRNSCYVDCDKSDWSLEESTMDEHERLTHKLDGGRARLMRLTQKLDIPSQDSHWQKGKTESELLFPLVRKHQYWTLFLMMSLRLLSQQSNL